MSDWTEILSNHPADEAPPTQDDALASLRTRLARAEAERDALQEAAQLMHQAYRPYREDLVRHALEAIDAALSTYDKAPA